jgi:hypothetical protein
VDLLHRPPSVAVYNGLLNRCLIGPFNVDDRGPTRTWSGPGPYEVEIRASDAVARTSARGNADFRNRITTLDISISTGSLSPGAYEFAVRRTGEGWQLFPMQIR